MNEYLMQFLPTPQHMIAGAAIVLTCAIAAMPAPKNEGVYAWLYNFAQSLPLPTFAHLRTGNASPKE